MAKQFLDKDGLNELVAQIKKQHNKLVDDNTETGSKQTAYKAMRDGDGQTISSTYVKTATRGVANGVATLDSSGKVPSSQLPSYVDDVLEYAQKSSFPATGEDGKIYVAENTNLTYRWSGSAYVEISPSLALGETASTAFPGNRGKALENNLSDLESQFSDLDEYAKEYLLNKITAVENKNTEQDTAINGKASVNHTHTFANITGLQSELDSKLKSTQTNNTGTNETDKYAITFSEDKFTITMTNKVTSPIQGEGSKALTISYSDGIKWNSKELLDESMVIPTSQITALFN